MMEEIVDLTEYAEEDPEIEKEIYHEPVSHESEMENEISEKKAEYGNCESALQMINTEIFNIDKEIEKLQRKRSELCAEQESIKLELQKHENERDTKMFETNKNSFEWSAELEHVRSNLFGIKSWRHNQLNAVNATISGRDCFVIMPTGGGKSLLYQLPACMSQSQGKFTLVISPLLALSQV